MGSVLAYFRGCLAADQRGAPAGDGGHAAAQRPVGFLVQAGALEFFGAYGVFGAHELFGEDNERDEYDDDCDNSCAPPGAPEAW